MKRATFRLNNGEEVTGWACDGAPGLVTYAYSPGWWTLFHEPTGLRICTLEKRANVNELAGLLAPLHDWTQRIVPSGLARDLTHLWLPIVWRELGERTAKRAKTRAKAMKEKQA